MGALRGRRRFSEREQLQLILRLPSGQIDQAGLLAETHWPEAKIKVAVNACHEPRAVARPCDDFLKAFTMSSRDSLKARSHSRTLPVAADAGAALMPALPVHASAGEDYAADPQRRRFLFPLARRRPSARVDCARSRGREAFFLLAQRSCISASSSPGTLICRTARRAASNLDRCGWCAPPARVQGSWVLTRAIPAVPRIPGRRRGWALEGPFLTG